MRWSPVIGMLAAVLVSGCTNQEDAMIEAGGRVLSRKTPQADPRIKGLVASSETILQVAFLEIEANGALLRESSRDGLETWISVEGASLTLESGMIVSARGIGSGLMASDISQSLAAVHSRQNRDVVRFHSFLTGNDEIDTRSYKCKIERADSQELKIADRKVNMNVMRETCESLDQNFLNLYWMDPSNSRILQSRQWVGGRVGVVLLREIKPPQ